MPGELLSKEAFPRRPQRPRSLHIHTRFGVGICYRLSSGSSAPSIVGSHEASFPVRQSAERLGTPTWVQPPQADPVLVCCRSSRDTCTIVPRHAGSNCWRPGDSVVPGDAIPDVDLRVLEGRCCAIQSSAPGTCLGSGLLPNASRKRYARPAGLTTHYATTYCLIPEILLCVSGFDVSSCLGSPGRKGLTVHIIMLTVLLSAQPGQLNSSTGTKKRDKSETEEIERWHSQSPATKALGLRNSILRRSQ